MRIALLVSIVCAIVSAPLLVSAEGFGRSDTWTKGYGQGIHEAIILGGARDSILVTCNAYQSPRVTGIWFSIGGAGPNGEWVSLGFDGVSPERFQLSVPGKGSRRADTPWFETVIEKLRTMSQVRVIFDDGRAADFTLNGAGQAIIECPFEQSS